MLMSSGRSDLGLFLLSLSSVKTGLRGEWASGNGHVCATVLSFAT